MTDKAKFPVKNKFFLFRKDFIILVLFLSAIMAGFIWGILFHKYKIFPYNNLKSAFKNMTNKKVYGPWSVGIYEGQTPFDLKPYKGIKNPVLTGKDCADSPYIADPFMIKKDGKYYMFFERLSRENLEGDIAYAESSDLKKWEYKQNIIDEKAHLSYPNVFKWKEDYYLVPESHQDLSVRLYKAESFPKKWKFVKKLVSGHSFVDPSIFRYNNKWWLFATTPANNILNLYYADDLMGEWKAHPMNPVVKFNTHISRPGGKIIIYKGKPYRFTQDCEPYYGIQIFAFEITELTEKTYSEKIVSKKPILTKSGKGWNAAGMHHIDLHKIGDKWIAIVDGKDRP
jgi:Glycosyl hydrolases family 43